MVHPDLLEILRCPICVREHENGGALELYKETWLLCTECDRKYPIVEDIPVMLVDEGEKWINTPSAFWTIGVAARAIATPPAG